MLTCPTASRGEATLKSRRSQKNKSGVGVPLRRLSWLLDFRCASEWYEHADWTHRQRVFPIVGEDAVEAVGRES